MSEIQLTPATGYDTSRMRFSVPIDGTVPESIPKIEFKRIIITTKYDDGQEGPLIIPTGRVFSFGVQENIDPKTRKVNGYVVPLCLFDREAPTQYQKEWVETFDNIVERIKTHLIKVREEIGDYNLELSDLKKFNPLYWKKDKGKIVSGTGPTLYTKLIESRKNGTILTLFFDKHDNPINAIDLLGKYLHTEAAVKIESIFIGAKITLQVKLYEASEIELTKGGMSRLMARPKAITEVKINDSMNPMTDPTENKDDILDSDNEDVMYLTKIKNPIKKGC